MKWLLVALGGLSMVALSAGAMGARPTPVTGWTAVGQVQAVSVSVAPAEVAAQALPEGRHQGGLETVQPTPKTAPAATSPVQVPVNPASGIVKPGCGGASRAGKPAPLCPPG